jgi:hypothetical protein
MRFVQHFDDNQQMTEITLEAGETTLSFKVDQDDAKTLLLEQFDRRNLTSDDVESPLLFEADFVLKKNSHNGFEFSLGGERYRFPVYESVEALPELEPKLDTGLTFEIELDCYDGPVSGIVSDGKAFHRFEWSYQSIGEGKISSSLPRLFHSNEIRVPNVSKWVHEFKALTSKINFYQDAKLGRLPMFANQRRALPDISQDEKRLGELNSEREHWPVEKISHKFYEFDANFAGINVVHISSQQQAWESSVAQALQAKNQVGLAALFNSAASPRQLETIYWIADTNLSETSLVMCDSGGRLLGADFILTPTHKHYRVAIHRPNS